MESEILTVKVVRKCVGLIQRSVQIISIAEMSLSFEMIDEEQMKEETVLYNDDQTQENIIANIKEYAEKEEETLPVLVKDEKECTDEIKKEETFSSN